MGGQYRRGRRHGYQRPGSFWSKVGLILLGAVLGFVAANIWDVDLGDQLENLQTLVGEERPISVAKRHAQDVLQSQIESDAAAVVLFTGASVQISWEYEVPQCVGGATSEGDCRRFDVEATATLRQCIGDAGGVTEYDFLIRVDMRQETAASDQLGKRGRDVLC